VSGLSLNDIERLEKQGWKKAESYGVDLTPAEESLQWDKAAIKQQNTRNNKVADVLDIGAGTRCNQCGMLHFCWIPKCGACGIDMDYNVGKVEATQ